MNTLPKILLFLLLVNTSFAQSKDERAVSEAVSRLTTAMETYDAQALEELTSPLLTYGHSNGLIEDKAEFIQNVTKGKTVFTEINLSDQWVRVSGKTATVRHILDAETSTSGILNTIQLKVLLVWVKEKGDWLLLARQAVK